MALARDYIIYVDVLATQLVANALFDFLLLWATSEITRTSSKPINLWMGSALGTLYFLLYELAGARMIPYFGILQYWPTLVAVSIGMILIAFWRVPVRRLGTLLGYFYGIALISGGAATAAATVINPENPSRLLGFAVAIATLLVVAELGWGIVQKRIMSHLYYVPIEVRFGDRRVVLSALVDTGNRLRDPVTGSPVIIVQQSALKSVLPPAIMAAIDQAGQPNLEAISAAVQGTPGWSHRLRVIPFASIGRDHGLLIGLRPDEIAVEANGQMLPVKGVVVGLHNRLLDPEGTFQALLHPEVIQRTFDSSSTSTAQQVSGRGNSANATTRIQHL